MSKAVFLSYASQDADAARRIADALRAAGVEVWFDQSELRGGDAWDQKIRGQIKTCALFVPIISANTQARREGYFRLEWRIAVERMRHMDDDLPFLVPVVIDETKDADAFVPERFRDVQWTRLMRGEPTPTFCAHVKNLLSGEPGARAVLDLRSLGEAGSPASFAPAGQQSALPGKRVRWFVPAIVGVTALILAALWQPWRGKRSLTQHPAMANSGTRASRPEVATLLARVRALAEKTDVVRTELDTAVGLLERASKIDPADANVWAQWALVDRRYVVEYFDVSPARLELARNHAAQGKGLDPANPLVRYAEAAILVTLNSPRAAVGKIGNRDSATIPAAIEILESVSGQLVDHAGPLLLLAQLKYRPAQPEAAFGYLERADRVAGWAGRAEMERALAFFWAGRFQDTENALDRALAKERAAHFRLWKSYLQTIWDGDVDAARRSIADLPPAMLAEDLPAAGRYFIELFARDYDRALASLRAVPRDYLNSVALSGPTGYYRGYVLARAGKAAAAQLEWRSALEVVNRRMAERPNDFDPLLFKALLLSALGQRTEGEKIWQSTRELYGDEVPSYPNFFALMEFLSDDGAVEELARMMQQSPWFVTAASLRMNPYLDRLRSNPKFIELLARAEADPRLSPKARSAQPANFKLETPNSKLAGEADAKSVAVLAFRHLTADPENEYLSEAISDELCSVLGRVPGLRVAATASSFSFKGRRVAPAEIGAQLGVAYLVDGTVQKVGSRVRVRAQLIKAADGFPVWTSDTLEHEVKDMFAVQDEVVASVAKNLQVQLGAKPAPVSINPEAYRLYYEGRRAWTLRGVDESMRQAEEFFRLAISADPKLGRAHAGLADASAARGRLNFGDRDSPEALELTRLATTGVMLEPDSADARASRARVLWLRWQFAEAEQEIRAAIRLNPNFAEAHLILGRWLETQGRLDEALVELQLATKLDPLTSRIFDNYSIALREAGRFEDSLVQAERALALQPNSAQGLIFKMYALSDLGRHEEAVTIARRPELVRADVACVVLARAGLSEEAARAYASVTQELAVRSTSPLRAYALCVMSRHEEALRALRPSDTPATLTAVLFYYDVFDRIRTDPRFEAYLKTLGIKEAHDRAQAWRAANRRTEVGSQGADKKGAAK